MASRGTIEQTGCTGACVCDFDIAAGPAPSAAAGLASRGGASGIIIDAVATGTSDVATSQIYFFAADQLACCGAGVPLAGVRAIDSSAAKA